MINTRCRLWGKNFSPGKLKNFFNINIYNHNEPGELRKIGIYRNKPTPYGACTIESPEGISDENKIEWMAEFIYKNKKEFHDIGIENIDFSIYWTGLQGNMYLTAKELKLLAKLDIDVSITYQYAD